MSEAPPPIDRDEELLSALAELDMALARKVHAAAMAAEAPKAIADLGRTYQRIARSLRQTLALKGQLKRQREAAAPRPKPLTANEDSKRILARFARRNLLRNAVLRVAWNERESLGDELDEVRRDLMDRTQAMLRAEDDDFLTDAVDDQVEALCADLGLPPHLAATWRDLPPAPEPDDDQEDEDADTS